MYILMQFLKNLTEFFLYTANNKDNFSYCFHNSVGDPMNTRKQRYKLYKCDKPVGADIIRQLDKWVCFMFAHKTNGEHGSPLREQRARHSHA